VHRKYVIASGSVTLEQSVVFVLQHDTGTSASAIADDQNASPEKQGPPPLPSPSNKWNSTRFNQRVQRFPIHTVHRMCSPILDMARQLPRLIISVAKCLYSHGVHITHNACGLCSSVSELPRLCTSSMHCIASYCSAQALKTCHDHLKNGKSWSL